MAPKILLLFFTVIGSNVAFNQTNELLLIDEFKSDFKVLNNELWQSLEDNNEISKGSDGQELQIISKFQKFGDILEKSFPHDITYGLSVLESSYAWSKAYSELRSIYALYESFRRFQEQQTGKGRLPSPRQAWLDLAETILHDSKSSVYKTSLKLFDIIKNEDLFKNSLKEVEIDNLCNIRESPQQIMLNLYNTVILTELKGYMMAQFAYMLQKLFEKEPNVHIERIDLQEKYELRGKEIVKKALETMKKASKQYWKCDPQRFTKNENYIEITELLQGYIQNEVDLNPEGTCMENCGYYTYTKSHSCYKNLYCREQRRCNGKIINCRFLDSDAWVCPSTSGNRRYQYVEYENGKILGRKQECRTTKVDSWWRWLFWHCSYCVCICDEQGINSDRYFNMRSSISNTQDNKVVTGLRFVRRNRIIHIQIQEGKLQPRGKIDLNTVRWVPVENYKLTDRNIYSGQDFHTLTWESRALDLDDLTAPSSHLLTGVRFKMIGAHLNFETHFTPFNYSSGKLQFAKGFWHDNSNTDAAQFNPRKKLNLENKNIPIHTTRPSVIDSKSDQYIEFTHTSLESDVAQTTVPFIDIQPVESAEAAPLAGAGIYHKGYSNFGGFIGLKTIGFDSTPLIQNAMKL